MADKLRSSKRQLQQQSPFKFSERKDGTDVKFFPILDCVPKTYKRIFFSDFKHTDNFAHKYIFGKIVQIWPIKKRPKNGNLRKLLITDVLEKDSEEKLTVFLFDKYACDSDGAEIDDFIIICDLEIENLTSLSQRSHNASFIPLQVLVQHDVINHPDRSIWISRPVDVDAENRHIDTVISERNLRKTAQQRRSISSSPKKTPIRKEDSSRIINGYPSPSPFKTPTSPQKAATEDGSPYNLRQKSRRNSSESSSPNNLRQKSPQKHHEQSSPKNLRQKSPQILPEQSSPKNVLSKTPQRSCSQHERSPNEQHKTQSYQYVTLGELSTLPPDNNKFFNIYAVVDDCELRTTTASFSQTLELILRDQTRAAFRCTICTSNKKYEGPFPNVHPGDIIRIHRLKVARVRGELRGSCMSHKFIVIFEKKVGESHPKTSAKSFTFTDDDKERVRELFHWLDRENSSKLICDIVRSENISVIAQVIGVYVSKMKECVCIKIWDGTKNENCLRQHLGLEGELIDNELFDLAEPYYINLFVYGNYCLSAGQLKPTQYVLVQHASLIPSNSSLQQTLIISVSHKEGRGVFLLQENDSRVSALKDRLDNIRQIMKSKRRELGDEDAAGFFLNCEIANNTQRVHQESASEAAIQTSGMSNNNNNNEGNATEVVAVTHAAVLPGDSTQKFGGIFDDVNRKRKPSNNDVNCNEEGNENTLRQQNTSNVQGIMDLNVDGEKNIDIEGIENFIQQIERVEPADNHCSQSLSQKNTQDLSSFLSQSSQDLWWKNLPDPISVVDGHHHIVPWTISEIKKKAAPFKFHVIAAVLNFKPETRSIEKLIRLYCSLCHFLSRSALISEVMQMLEICCVENELPRFFCPNCKNSVKDGKYPMLEYSFLIDFTLEDGSSGMIEAYLWRENAVKFFKGIKPEEALLSKPVANSVFEMLWKVCPNCRPTEVVAEVAYVFYPVLDCCIKSYNAGGSVRYQLFDTIAI